MLILGSTSWINDTVMAAIAVAVIGFYWRKSHVNFLVVMCVCYQEGRGDPWDGATRNGIEIGVQTGYSSQSRQRYFSK
jgi:hypothetical protein